MADYLGIGKCVIYGINLPTPGGVVSIVKFKPRPKSDGKIVTVDSYVYIPLPMLVPMP